MFDLTLKTSPDIVCIQQQQQKTTITTNKNIYSSCIHRVLHPLTTETITRHFYTGVPLALQHNLK